MRVRCSITRADLDQALPDGRELSDRERVCLRDGGSHAMHQPERGGVECEPGRLPISKRSWSSLNTLAW